MRSLSPFLVAALVAVASPCYARLMVDSTLGLYEVTWQPERSQVRANHHRESVCVYFALSPSLPLLFNTPAHEIFPEDYEQRDGR